MRVCAWLRGFRWAVLGSNPGHSRGTGGRPKGLPRYVRELVGDDGRRIADFMLGVLEDESERTETRMQAAQWLADRGFGRCPLPLA